MKCYRQRPRGAIALALVASLFLATGLSAHADPPQKKNASAASKTSALDPELQAAIKTAPDASKWPNNDYIRLLDIGNVTVKSDGTIIAEYRETYKLFNERARDLAEVSLPYNSSYQTLKVLRARTVKKDGTVLEVKPEDIRATSPYSDYLMYDDAMNVSFSMPGVEDDCIIDYTFQEVTRPLLMPGQFWTYWGYSGPEPVGLCRYKLSAPADKPIKFKVYNDDTVKPTIVSSVDGHTKTYTWEMRDIKPIELEPAMPDMSDVRIWMEVSSLSSWQDVAQWFWGLQKPQAVADPAIKTTVNNLITGKMTDEDKARVIYDWVANRTRYVGLEFGLSAYKPHAAPEVHKNLYGDCKDKATLLITMLNLAGIKAHPVLLHAEDRRLVEPGLPTLNAFNHCIALADVGGKEVWLDATAETSAYGDIPEGDRGVQALVVRDGVGKFETIPIYTGEENGVNVKTDVALKPDGGADMQVTMTMRGASGQGMRAAVRAITPEKRKEMAQRIAQALSPGAIVKDYTLPDGTDKIGPYVLKMSVSAPNYAKKTGHLLLVPMLGGVSGAERHNPFIKEKRLWPIVEEDTSLTHGETVITLPEGYALDDTPADVNLTGALQEYHRTLSKSADGRTLTVTEMTSEHPGKVPASDYAKVKSYYDDCIKIADDQIVLKAAK
jgi:hypothetical protein